MKNKKQSNILNYRLFCQTLSPKDLHFKTTSELTPLTDFFGQDRALQSIIFGIGIKKPGYNIFAMGPTGFGKRTLVKNILQKQSLKDTTPSDWCYIHNFEFPGKPISVALPPGRGIVLLQDMKKFVSAMSMHILGMFESDEYNNSIRKINLSFNRRRNKIGKKKKSKIPFYIKFQDCIKKDMKSKLNYRKILLKLRLHH